MMMETLVVHAHHRNQYHRGKSQASRGFKGINCRTFQSSGGILPSPPPKTDSFNSNSQQRSPSFYSEPPRARRSKSIPIPISGSPPSPRALSFTDDYACSELWAGPAYSNSPPPSSLPMPKFSLRQKRSVSLELNVVKPDVVIHPMSKSAPSSPTRASGLADVDFFMYNATATEDLKRILNLDVADD